MKFKALVLVAIAVASLSACEKTPEQLQKEAEEAQIRKDTIEKTAAEKQSVQDYRDSLKRPGVLQNTVMTQADIKRSDEEFKKAIAADEKRRSGAR